MPDLHACPAAQDLMQFTAGQLSDDRAQPIEQHLKDCPHCVAALGALKTDDPLLASLRAAGAATGPRESAVVEGLIGQLRELPTVAASGADEATLPPSALVGLPAAASTPNEYGFLAPPQGLGELGRLGPYRVLKVLGAGGMGVVFQAEDIHLQRLVALKAMNPSLAASAAGRERFLLEARATAAIEHDHIVTIHQVGEDRGVPFFAMPLLKGETLDDRLKREGRLPPGDVVRIGREVAEGLAAAHERGLIHRDIKPANVWLEAGKDRVKILDFGLVRAAGGDKHLTKPGTILGTPEYMPPEQIRGATVDHRGDLFSLGCLLYRMGTGALPFQGNDAVVTLMAVATEDPPPPQAVNPEIPLPLSLLILRLLAKEPDGRPGAAQEVAQALQAMAGGQAQRVAAPAPDQTSNLFALRMPVPDRRPPADATRWRWRFALGMAVLLSCLGAAGFFWGPALFQVTTDEGELVVETDDPQVAVLINKRGGVTIEDRKRGLTYNLRVGGQKLPAGGYELAVSSPEAGLEFQTRRFTILRDKQVVVKAWVKSRLGPDSHGGIAGPRIPPPKDAATDFDVLLEADSAAYLAWIHRQDAAGFRATALSVHSLAGRPRFAAIAVKTDEQPGWWTLVDQDRDSYVSRFHELEEEKYREIMGAMYQVGGETRYASLWSKDGVGPWQSNADLTEESYLRRRSTLKAQGYRLASVAVSDGRDGRRFLDHWIPDGGLAWDEQHDLTAERLQAVLAATRAKKWRPDFLHAYQDRAGTRFIAVLVENREDAAWTAQVDLSPAQYRRELATQKGHHLRPLSVAGYAAQAESRYAGVWIHYTPYDGQNPGPPRTDAAARWSLLYEADPSAFKEWLGRVRADGFRPVSVNGHSLAGKPRLAAVAVKDGRDLPCDVYLDKLAEFPRRYETLVAQGHWVAHYTVYRDGDTLACASLWLPHKVANGYHRSRINISSEDYQKEVDAAEENHAYPYRVAAFPEGASYRLAAFFAPAPTPKWKAAHGLTGQECQAYLDGWRGQGYRPESIFVGPDKGALRFGAVLLPEQPALDWEAKLDLSAEDLQHEQQRHKARGYRPQLVVGYVRNGGSRYLAVWVRDALAAFGFLGKSASNPVGQISNLPKEAGKLETCPTGF